jgi:LysM repeat protein
MDPEEETQHRHSDGELVKFMILVAILLLTVLLVAAARPLVFDYIVPAALGWEAPLSGSPVAPHTPRVPVLAPSLTETPATSTPESGSDTVEDVLIPAATVTPLPTPTLPSYRVETGDNLTRIARRFGVTVEALANANNLTDLNRLMPGDILIIPAP